MTQDWNPRLYERNAAFVAEYGLEVVKLLKPCPGERILDVGCGDGRLPQALVAAGSTVVGVDSSPQQVEAAREHGLDVLVRDAESVDFTEEFDSVFSNAALHWVKQPQKVVEGVWRALSPGGRFVGEFGAHGNVKTICGAIADRLEFLEDVRDTLRPHLQDNDGTWFADYVRLRFAATKPG